MIQPLQFVWKQFTGSQVGAVCHGVWKYFKDNYDTTLEYWRNLTIDTANNSHLTLIGILQGLARPLIPLPDEKYLLLSETYNMVPGHGVLPGEDTSDWKIPDAEYPSVRGLATQEGYPFEEGFGVFDEIQTIGGYQCVGSEIFRRILKGNSESDGYLGSLVALDDILYELWRYNHAEIEPVYRFNWCKLEANPLNTPGDIIVDLGTSGDWYSGYEIAAEIRVLGRTIYYPIPRIIAKLVEGDAQVDPVGLIRIRALTDYTADPIVYGLDAMWAGEGTPSDTVDDGVNPEWTMSPLQIFELTAMWNGTSTIIDDPDPSEDFTAIDESSLANMWL